MGEAPGNRKRLVQENVERLADAPRERLEAARRRAWEDVTEGLRWVDLTTQALDLQKQRQH